MTLRSRILLVLGGAVLVANSTGCERALGQHGDGLDAGTTASTDAGIDLSASNLDLGHVGEFDAGGTVDAIAAVDAVTDQVVNPGCPAGEHMCPGGCAMNSDPRTCGSSCTPCQAPIDGAATCDGTACGSACPTGRRLCQNACIASTACCTSSDCAAGDPNKIGTCDSSTHACSAACASGFKSCTAGGVCVSAANCCTNADCAAGTANTAGICDAALGTCSYPCAAGFQNCGGACIASTTCCLSSCPTTAGGTPVCAGASCDIACSAASYTCSSSPKTCRPHVITFESGTIEGFTVDPVNAPPGATAINAPLPAVRPDGGGGARALAYPINQATFGSTMFEMPLCSVGTTNLLGAHLSVWVYIQSATALALNSSANILLFTQAGSYFPLPFMFNPPPINTWFQVTGTADVATNTNNALATSAQTIGLFFDSNAVAPWAGTVYFDDLTIGP